MTAGCPLCDRTGHLPSGRVCDHVDPDGSRLAMLRRIQAQYPPCAVCGAPMTAGQKVTHWSCQPAAQPTAPKSQIAKMERQTTTTEGKR